MPKALVLSRSDKTVTSSIRELSEDELPEGDVIVDVLYSSINYKDALAVTGKGRIIRGSYPFVPGIDLAGTVRSSSSPQFSPGDHVIGTGWGLGENHWGGYSTTMRLQSKWLVPMPDGMSAKTAMGLGTAGFTAMLSVLALEEHNIQPSSGEIVVTGATGGVGSLSIALLNKRGYTVVASTGKSEAAEFLKSLGADRIIDRQQLGQGPLKPLDTGYWAGAVDTVGGPTLSAVLSQTNRHGSVAACGLAGGAMLDTTVFPFILRGVNLLGIDSNTCPTDRRIQAWEQLNIDISESLMDGMSQVVLLSEVPEMCDTLMAGKIKGRIIVDVNAS